MSNEITFSCLSCGQRIVCGTDESGRPILCPSCGANLTVPHQMDEIRAPVPPESPEPVVVPRTSGLAVASLVCSLLSPVICIGWLPGIICGHLARSAIRRNPALTGKGVAMAGLVIGYATVILIAASSAFIFTWYSASFKGAFDQARQLLSTNSPIAVSSPQVQSLTPIDTDDTQQAQSNGTGWTMDVKDAQIPAAPAAGEIHGNDFQCKRALYRSGNLKLLSSDGSFVLIRGLGTSIENNSFEFQTASGGDAPKIQLLSKDQGQNQSEIFQEGYAMELKFDAAKRRKIHGEIYLCLPDDSKSYIAGTFTITLPKPKPSPPAEQ